MKNFTYRPRKRKVRRFKPKHLRHRKKLGPKSTWRIR
jgi:hypothetical protein